MARILILDNEPVQALLQVQHPKHRSGRTPSKHPRNLPVDSHIGAVVEASQGDVAILTSDVDDLRRIVQHIGKRATVVLI